MEKLNMRTDVQPLAESGDGETRRKETHGICILKSDMTEREQAGTHPKCRHTPSPVGYLAMSEWAARKLKTHKQERCPHCGLWAIWTPKATKNAIAKMLKELSQ